MFRAAATSLPSTDESLTVERMSRVAVVVDADIAMEPVANACQLAVDVGLNPASGSDDVVEALRLVSPLLVASPLSLIVVSPEEFIVPSSVPEASPYAPESEAVSEVVPEELVSELVLLET